MSVQQFEQEVLQAHNSYRAKHGVPALTLSPKLNQLATDWAKHLLSINRLEHRQNSGYGENLYMASGGNLEGKDAVRSWYEEIKHYNWNNPSFQPSTGHFTQVVWKSSSELGVGFARRDNTIYVVCNYNPPGNYINQFRENVLPPRQ
ncbi:LOW QUALITY PROTEIN: Golgi-associated plant pathogenesis-related protein 1 [Drosophila eugracilis]|uniref:LOW QUALITY PROTEIN: Golgi-associated plant pathogenesis-related protein 1 n=1 Tax=Drosophila eugracilis TaxID=29029 RepID=UPI001BDAB0DC|nr:LOW QUALITY PROTEIN: Golgi-associated plant pathogenesis-related protein 1 [Drosophila eugracilis]